MIRASHLPEGLHQVIRRLTADNTFLYFINHTKHEMWMGAMETEERTKRVLTNHARFNLRQGE